MNLFNLAPYAQPTAAELRANIARDKERAAEAKGRGFLALQIQLEAQARLGERALARLEGVAPTSGIRQTQAGIVPVVSAAPRRLTLIDVAPPAQERRVG